MKFIREMITRKNQPADTEEGQIEEDLIEEDLIEEDLIEEDSAVLEDLGAAEPTDDEFYSGIAAIQSLLDETPEALDEDELAELAALEAADAKGPVVSAPAVVNFADLVSDIQKPKTEAVQPAASPAKDPEVKPSVAPEKNAEEPDAAAETVPAEPAEPVVAKTDNMAKTKATANDQDNAKTADKLAAALGPGVTVTVKDRPPSKHAAFDQKRFVTTDEPDADEIAEPSAEVSSEPASSDVEQTEPVEIKTEPKAAPRTPPKLVAPEAEERTPPDGETEAKEPTAPANIIEVPAPAAGRSGRRAGRVKTRLLGFNQGAEADNDPFDIKSSQIETAKACYPTGWIVIVDGPGRGTSFTLYNGVSQIGRGDDQPIKLAFGDTSISRSNHAAIAYDDQEHKFFLGHGGKANLVRLNDRPVLSTEEISSNDLIRIGETTLRFVGFCGAHFDWGDGAPEEMEDAAIA